MPRGKLTLSKTYFLRASLAPKLPDTWDFDRFFLSRRYAPGSELNLPGRPPHNDYAGTVLASPALHRLGECLWRDAEQFRRPGWRPTYFHRSVNQPTPDIRQIGDHREPVFYRWKIKIGLHGHTLIYELQIVGPQFPFPG